jgi:ATP dependent DNA ligase C terminal region
MLSTLIHGSRLILQSSHMHIVIIRDQEVSIIAHKDSEPLLRLRLGEDISLQSLEYGERICIKGVYFSLHPAGHVIYAQKGHGRRAELYTDYTFGVWDSNKLIPFAKAYSGSTDVEIKEVDKFVKQNTLGKFGPVRTVKPQVIFEIGFQRINVSPRHKSGIAVRFPCILRWRRDKHVEEADTLRTLQGILAGYQ